MENIIFSLISYSGEARSLCMEAMSSARQGHFEEAKEKLKSAEECLSNAHKAQTDLIQKEAGGEKTEISLLLIHAQDHLMTSMTLREVALEMLELYKKVS